MPVNEPKLEATELTQNAIAIIDQLQDWLAQAEFEEHAAGPVRRLYRYWNCISYDWVERLKPLEMEMNNQVGHSRVETFQPY